MNTWITSDIHLGHTKIIEYAPKYRQYSDVDEMNEAIVAGWNAQVQPDDLTYILGDVAFCNPKKATEFMHRMNGRKILIEGNHDRKLVKDAAFRACFEEIHKYHEVNYNGVKLVMCHFPFLEWNQMQNGSLHFFGHVHGDKTGQEQYRCKDVGMDATGQIVITMKDAIASIINNEIKKHH